MDIITLHLTTNGCYSRVDLHLDGEDFQAPFHGVGHAAAARAFAVRLRDALKAGSKAAALNLIA